MKVVRALAIVLLTVIAMVQDYQLRKARRQVDEAFSQTREAIEVAKKWRDSAIDWQDKCKVSIGHIAFCSPGQWLDENGNCQQ